MSLKLKPQKPKRRTMADWRVAQGLARKLKPNTLTDVEAWALIDGEPERTLSEADFRGYQHYMTDRVVRDKLVYLAADMGLGKTGAVLKAIRRLLDEGQVRKVLIVAPLRVAQYTWPDEFKVWTFARPMSFSILAGTDEERIQAANDDSEIHIINRENVVWLYKHFRDAKKPWPYDMLVYDEASRLKGGKQRSAISKRADGSTTGNRLNEFGTLAKVRRYFDRVVELSGTPAPNGLQDLWGPAYILDRGFRLGDKRTAFMNRWFSTNPHSHEIKAWPHAEREIMGLLSDVMVSLREEDYLELPPLRVNDVMVTLPPKLMTAYRKFERTLYLEEYDVEAVNNGVLTNKLLQYANGSIYVDDDQAKFVHDLKLDALESIVSEASGAPILIAYSFRFDMDRIKRRFPKFRIFGESANDVRDWNAGRVPGMIMHPASAGHGLNIQFGGNIAVWYGLNWSLELYQQFVKRLHRSGQKHDHVMMHRIMARGTEDENVASGLVVKGGSQDSIKNAVRIRAADLRRMAA